MSSMGKAEWIIHVLTWIRRVADSGAVALVLNEAEWKAHWA